MNDKNVDAIRKKHALMDCDYEIRCRKSILNSADATEEDKMYAREEIARMEAMKKRILAM